MNYKFVFLLILNGLFTSIGNGSEKIIAVKNVKYVVINTNFNQTKTEQDYLQKIRGNYARINNVKKWSKIITKDVHESIESGELIYYYLNGILEKVTEKNYGEMWQDESKYYFLNGKLSFVLERMFRYNRPFYYDQKAMRENNDTEYFDFKKSTITETRNYLYRSKLFKQIFSIKNSSKITEKEQVRLTKKYNFVIKNK